MTGFMVKGEKVPFVCHHGLYRVTLLFFIIQMIHCFLQIFQFGFLMSPRPCILEHPLKLIGGTIDRVN
jgi:hypothetical protein